MNTDSFITLQTSRSIHRVMMDDITYVHCDSSVSEVVLYNKTVIPTARPLLYFESMLPDSIFVRISRNCIVNVNYLVEVRSEGTRKKTCILSGGRELAVSYRRWPDLRALILR